MSLPAPFMRIPSEIRLVIYHLLLDDKDNEVLEIRNEDPDDFKNRISTSRTCYNVLGRDLVRQSRQTTYCLITDVEMHTSIMGVNRKIYQETSHLLYSTHSFGFNRDVEAIVPFLGDLTIQTRPLVQRISLVKQGSVYSRDYDRCEWTEACKFLRESMQLRSLKLVVEGGRPSLGWDGLPTYTAEDFLTLSKVRHEPLEWVWELLGIKGLQNLDIGAEIHHCAPSHSSGTEFFAAFSSSIKQGFTEFMKAELLRG
jgi:hypothetical protein